MAIPSKKISRALIAKSLAAYGLAHMMVDAACAAVLFSALAINSLDPLSFLYLVIVYDAIAFTFQPIFGIISDSWKKPKGFAIFGGIMTLISVGFINLNPLFAAIIAGTGNAIFHIGGGTISLNLTPRKATAPGIFVAPGAIGLLLGTFAAKSPAVGLVVISFALLLSCLFMFWTRSPPIDYETPSGKKVPEYFGLMLVLLLASISIRSVIGLVIQMPWKSDLSLLIILTLAVSAGKLFGGVLADRFGWISIAAGGLLLSAPLISFYSEIPALGILGLFLFNFTMPVALVAVSNSLPGKPGFSFGLNCFALAIGAFIAFDSSLKLFFSKELIFTTVALTSVILYSGLRIYLSGTKAKR